MKGLFVCMFALLAGFARGQSFVTAGGLELAVGFNAVTPARLVRSDVPRDLDEERRTRFMITFNVRLRNVGEKDVVVPTYLGREEAQQRSAGPEGVEVHYDFRIEKENDLTVVKSPVFFRFVTLHPGEAVYLPPYITYAPDLAALKPHKFVFRVRGDFSARFDCWSGGLSADIDPTKKPSKARQP